MAADAIEKSAAVLVHLLDPIHGRPIQTWRFESMKVISIGRADERDVVVTDVYVSRQHAELQLRATGWVLVSTGRNGILVKGQQITELPATSDLIFRLGPNGPMMQFQLARGGQTNDRTLSNDTAPIFMFRFDEEKIKREADEIAAGDFFNTLQQKAKAMREKRLSE